MNRLKELIDKYFSGITPLIKVLGIIAWLLFAGVIFSFFLITLNEHLTWLPTSKGLNNLFEFYKFPLTLSASLIAILSLKVAFMRVKQTDRQLESSYKPELYVDKCVLNLTSRLNGNHVDRFIFNTNNLLSGQPIIYVFNVGLAVAKEIRCHYNFDIEKALGIIGELDTDSIFILNYKNDQLEIDSSKTKYKKTFYSISIQNREKYSNFLLPASDKTINLEVNLPIYYCELFTIFNFLGLNSKLENKYDKVSKDKISSVIPKFFPKLLFTLSYKDLGNKMITKIFEINFNVPFFVLPIVDGEILDRKNEFFVDAKEII